MRGLQRSWEAAVQLRALTWYPSFSPCTCGWVPTPCSRKLICAVCIHFLFLLVTPQSFGPSGFWYGSGRLKYMLEQEPYMWRLSTLRLETCNYQNRKIHVKVVLLYFYTGSITAGTCIFSTVVERNQEHQFNLDDPNILLKYRILPITIVFIVLR